MLAVRRFADLPDADRAAVFAFAQRFAPDRFPTPEAMGTEFAEPHYEHGATQLSVWDGGAIVACIGAVCQGQGVGRLLLSRAVSTLQEAGAETIKLRVISSNQPAVSLYEKVGFVRGHSVSHWLERPSG